MKRVAVAILALACLPVLPVTDPVVASRPVLRPYGPVALPTVATPAPRPSRAVQRPRPTPSPASRSRTHRPKEVYHGYPTEAQWARLRHCESSGNYQSRGRFFGAYQFDLSTWRSVGGSGNPADASPQEQDARAKRLYGQRGRQPWPQCGRYL